MIKALLFSGGKDSLACLYLYRDDPEIVVIYGDTGSAFPHVRDFVHRTVEALSLPLYVAKPEISVKHWQDINGLPSDLVPWDATPMMRGMVKDAPKVSVVPYSTCCTVNLWNPTQQAVRDVGATIVIRGSKASDERVGVPDGFIEDGITYLSPIWNWSDADVFSYLSDVGAEIPPQYAVGGDSLDCWCCTAYMKHGAARFSYLKEHYPHLYAEAKRRLGAVSDAVSSVAHRYLSESEHA